MTSLRHDKARRIVLVSRSQSGEALRSAQAIEKLAQVCLLGISQYLPLADDGRIFVDHLQVENIHDSNQLILAARALVDKHAGLDLIVTTTETLLEPVAQANESLGLQGMTVSTVNQVLDKSRLKSVLAGAGLPTARDCMISSDEIARNFVAEVGFPIVFKPIKGSGGLATWCIQSAEQLDLALQVLQVSTSDPVLAEAYIYGQELCIDTITLRNEPRFYSLCFYRPSILDALQNPRTQWCCILPRDITGEPYQDFIEQGLKAIRALSVGNAMTHMEGFLTRGGEVCFTDATLRPAGARIAPMLAFAYDIDPYFAWARAVVDGRFDGPWERKYAVGTIFLRGIGSGLIQSEQGIESVRRDFGDLIVEAHMPRIGTAKSSTYTGDGFVTVRHPITQIVEDALQLIAQTVHISYSETDSIAPLTGSRREAWNQQSRYFHHDSSRPVWENNCLPNLDD